LLVGITSDTHGYRGRIRECASDLQQCDYILHAGDFYEDSQYIAAYTNRRVIAVVGNCDHMVSGPVEETVVLGGKKIYLTHGHLYKVKQGTTLLARKAKSLKSDIVVYGHTHSPRVFEEDGILFINPGSLSMPRHDSRASFVVMEILKDVVRTAIVVVA
jgi:putative phosphoesterase